MNLFLQTISLLSALVVFLTIVAQLGDHQKPPVATGLMEAIRHHLSILGLVAIGAGAISVMAIVLTFRVPAIPVVAFVTGVALRQLTHPDSWWAFVIRGIPHIPWPRRRFQL